MEWTKLGIRWQPIYYKSQKLLAWSKVLKKEIGFGYTKFIATKDGSQYVLADEDLKITKTLKNRQPSLKYLYKTDQINGQIEDLLIGSDPDFVKIIDLSLKQLVYFYIANGEADLLFKSPITSLEDKRVIERWRNNPDHFIGDDKVLGALSKRLGVKASLLEKMTVTEVMRFLKGEAIDLGKIQKRAAKDWSLSLIHGQVEFVPKNLTPVEKYISREIKGNPVFKLDKKIKGVVGRDILVTHMTSPEMTTKISQMKAVITDEGGVLCHAAITCREYRIPGIVGTKVATKFLREGMEVELDLKNGAVRIIK